MAGSPEGYVSVANLEIMAVSPQAEGFRLQGLGADGADYLVDLHLDIPIDQQTRSVMSELLSQSEWQVFRRVREPLPPRRTAARAESRPG
ncbi:MAG: hypothetical protein O7I93_09885 [Gemmatimonadetes bacterium]|nr:hypothetical protein [Gemmatimonadota bacterium]